MNIIREFCWLAWYCLHRAVGVDLMELPPRKEAP